MNLFVDGRRGSSNHWIRVHASWIGGIRARCRFNWDQALPTERMYLPRSPWIELACPFARYFHTHASYLYPSESDTFLLYSERILRCSSGSRESQLAQQKPSDQLDHAVDAA
jgi:hypothetical protein